MTDSVAHIDAANPDIFAFIKEMTVGILIICITYKRKLVFVARQSLTLLCKAIDGIRTIPIVKRDCV